MKKKIYGILTLLFGALVLYMAFHVSNEVRTKKDWPTVEGTIVERGGGKTVGTRATSVRARAKYNYVVDGKPYTNDQVHLIATTGADIRDMKKLEDGLPDKLPVHYNPSNPAESYLLPSSMAWFWILLPVGILLSLIGAGILLSSRSGK